MADLTPDYFVEQQKLRSQIAGLRHNFEKQTLENMQLHQRIQSNIDNIDATTKSITELDVKLQDLVKTHGIPDRPISQSFDDEDPSLQE